MTQTTPIAIRVEQYIALRNKIREAEDAHKKAMAPKKSTLEKLGNLILTHLQQNQADSISGHGGTAFITTRRSASIADGEAFWDFVTQHKAWDLIDKRANAVAIEDYANQNGKLPPGVNFNKMFALNVRTK